ncbi:MAG: zinc ribbon domain-containing protein [Actinobacteria bacterium]|nr:zinc ribbon domain-containing protein [Actinomycetota bacterium]
MPTFEFDCLSCGERFDLLVGVGRSSDARCPECGGSELKQRITAFRVGGVSRAEASGGSACSSCSSSDCSTCGR